jgi:hypothetical protein
VHGLKLTVHHHNGQLIHASASTLFELTEVRATIFLTGYRKQYRFLLFAWVFFTVLAAAEFF